MRVMDYANIVFESVMGMLHAMFGIIVGLALTALLLISCAVLLIGMFKFLSWGVT